MLSSRVRGVNTDNIEGGGCVTEVITAADGLRPRGLSNRRRATLLFDNGEPERCERFKTGR